VTTWLVIEPAIRKLSTDISQIGFQILPKRWVTERTNAWISRQRRLPAIMSELPLPANRSFMPT
jgi:hypothetical protein